MLSLRDSHTQLWIGLLASAVLLVLPVQSVLPLGPVSISLLEAFAVVTSAWSVWFLAKNNPHGWWIGLIGVTAYAVVFYEVKLYAEVGIQVVYFVTSLQAIYLWLHGGKARTERPVGRVPRRWLVLSAVAGIVATFALREALIAMRGAVPFWDALTTIVSLIAHVFLMGRYVESWYLWIAVDTIYVPLYASRGLYLTSGLYAVFWLMAVYGLRTFQRVYREQGLPP